MSFPQHHHLSASPSVNPSPPPPSRLRKTELSLRILAALSAIAGFSFLITDKQSRSFTFFQTVLTKEARYSDMKALVYSVVSLGIVALYSISQAARCFLAASSKGIHPSSSLAWTVFLLDQVMTYFILTSSSASAQSAYFSEQGNDGFTWPKVCYLYENFCKQVGAGIISSFIAFMALVFTSVISAFHLFASTE